MSTTLAVALVATGLRLVASHAYVEGAPAGFSGGFKEDSCLACHFGQEVNARPGTLTIAGLPAAFAPGEHYTLTLTLRRPGMKLGGFQLAARFAASGAQAGTLTPGPDEGRVKVDSPTGIQYASQRKAGTVPGADDVITWTVQWTAPASGGPVIVHVSANAADGNESADGDFVYTASARASPRAHE